MNRPERIGRDPDADYSVSLSFLRSHRQEFETLWNKYTASGATDYWPRLTPSYFAPQFDAVDAALEKHEIERRIRIEKAKAAAEE